MEWIRSTLHLKEFAKTFVDYGFDRWEFVWEAERSDLKAMGIDKDPIIETMSKAALVEKCVAYGLKRTLGIKEMRSKLNEINGEI